MTIASLKGRAPVGCVLRVGKKGDRGFPVDRHRFYLCKTTMEGKGRAALRPMHPSFAPFNNRTGPKEAHPCSTVTIRLAHVDRDSCFDSHLHAQVDPRRNKAVPNMRPWCTGDGVRASRWDFDAGDYRSIACPDTHCEFRKKGSGARGATACKPNVRLLGQLVWADGVPMPNMLMKLSSNSWNTGSALLGFFDYFDEIALALTRMGADLVDFIESYDDAGELETKVTKRRYSMLGFRLSVTVQEKADQDLDGKPRNYPIVTFTPVDDVREHLLMQAVTMKQLAEAGHMASAMLTDSQHGSEEVRTIDFLDSEVGTATDGSTT